MQHSHSEVCHSPNGTQDEEGRSGRTKTSNPFCGSDFADLLTQGLPLVDQHTTDEINVKLKVQAFMSDGCYGDEDDINWGCDMSTIAGGFYIFEVKGCLETRSRTIGVATARQTKLNKYQFLLRLVA